MGDTSSNCCFSTVMLVFGRKKISPWHPPLTKWGPILQAGWMIQCYFKLDTDKFAGMDNHPGPGIWFSSISVDIIFFSSWSYILHFFLSEWVYIKLAKGGRQRWTEGQLMWSYRRGTMKPWNCYRGTTWKNLKTSCPTLPKPTSPATNKAIMV